MRCYWNAFFVSSPRSWMISRKLNDSRFRLQSGESYIHFPVKWDQGTGVGRKPQLRVELGVRKFTRAMIQQDRAPPPRTTQRLTSPSEPLFSKTSQLWGSASWRGTRRKNPTDNTLGSIPTSSELFYFHLLTSMKYLPGLEDSPKGFTRVMHVTFTSLGGGHCYFSPSQIANQWWGCNSDWGNSVPSPGSQPSEISKHWLEAWVTLLCMHGLRAIAPLQGLLPCL